MADRNAALTPAAPLTPPKKRKKAKQPLKRYAVFFFLPTAAAFTLAFLAPFLWGIFLSFCEFFTITDATWIGLDNYRRALQDVGFLYSFGFSALFTLVTVVLINVAAFFVAYALTRKIRGSNLFRTVFFMPNLIGGIVLGFIWQILLNGLLGLYGTSLAASTAYGFWGLVLLTAWQQIGYMMIIYISGLQNVPHTMLEAAKIDGATAWQTLRKVIIPQVRPSITICTFLTLTNSFKLYDQNAALTPNSLPYKILEDGSHIKTTATIAKNIVDQFNENYFGTDGIAQAKSILFFLVVVVIALLQLYFTRKKEESA